MINPPGVESRGNCCGVGSAGLLSSSEALRPATLSNLLMASPLTGAPCKPLWANTCSVSRGLQGHC